MDEGLVWNTPENHCPEGSDDEIFWLLVRSGEEMRRDLDYMRGLLAELEASPRWQFQLLAT